MGTHTIETQFNSDSGSPPFTRIDGGVLENKGLYALHSAAHSTNFLYFLDSNLMVTRVTGYQAQEITPPALAHRFKEIATGDEIGFVVTIEGQVIYVLNFTDETWAFSETTGQWFQLSYGVNGGRHLMNSYQFCYGKHLVTDYRNGNIYELDPDTFTDNGEVQIRERVTPPINGISLGLPQSRFLMSRFSLDIHTGVGIASGQGSSPQFLMYYSVDGGRTWTNQGTAGYVNPGESGNYITRVNFDAMVSFIDLLIKIKVSDPVFVSIHGASITVEQCEGW
jgi:hypothetical protein